jgi:hypothetical protein
MTGDTVYALLAIENEDEGRFSIFVQDPATWPTNATRPPTLRTIEGAVRHECAHIRVRDFAPRNPSDADILAEERAVWAISDAFDKVNELNAPQFAAMVVRQLDRKPQTLSQVAANVRAMAATTAATRRQTKGINMAMDPATAKMLLDALDSNADPAAAIAAVRKVVEDALTGGQDAPASVPDPNAPPMGADAGNVPANDPSKGGKMPPDAMRAMSAELQSVRAMGAEVRQLRDELKSAADIVRPTAKAELVRAMRADGIAITPHQEKLITDAPSLEVAKDRAATMRAMGAAPGKPPAKQPGDGSGLTPAQDAKYRSMVAANNPRAEAYRDECEKKNARDKKAGAR